MFGERLVGQSETVHGYIRVGELDDLIDDVGSEEGEESSEGSISAASTAALEEEVRKLDLATIRRLQGVYASVRKEKERGRPGVEEGQPEGLEAGTAQDAVATATGSPHRSYWAARIRKTSSKPSPNASTPDEAESCNW